MTSTIARLRWPQTGLIPLSLLLLWPAAINGGPFVFADTPSYVHAADALAVRVTGHASPWSNADVRRIAARPVRGPAGPPASREHLKPVLLGRSVYYSLLAYVGVIAGSPWLTLALQALFVGAVVFGLLRHVVDPADRRRFALAIAAAYAALATTPIAFFASMLMPDVFTGTTVVAAAALIAGWRRERPAGRVGWLVTASYGALAHSSHVLILLAIAAAALVAARWAPAVSRRGAATALLAAAVGLAGESGFSLAVRAMTGQAPIRPPFLTARLVEDGPGTAYLRTHCDPPTLLLCRYRDRLPLPSDSLLWARGSDGVFKTLPPAGQRELAGEQARFVWRVAADRPLAVIGSSLAAIGRQAADWRLVEFNQPPQEVALIATHLPAADRATFVASAAARRVMPTGLVTALIPVWTLAGLIALVLVFVNPGSRRAIGGYGAVFVGGWAVDLAVCGALSTPHDRYQARVIWLMALWSVAAVLWWSKRKGAAASAGTPIP